MVPLSETASSTQVTLSWRRPLSYRNQSIDLQSKSMDWFLYDNGPRPERVKRANSVSTFKDNVKKHYLTWIIHNVYRWIRVSASIYVCMSLGVCIYTNGYLLVCFPLIYPLFFFSLTIFSHFASVLKKGVSFRFVLSQPLLMLFISVCSNNSFSSFMFY